MSSMAVELEEIYPREAVSRVSVNHVRYHVLHLNAYLGLPWLSKCATYAVDTLEMVVTQTHHTVVIRDT